MVAIHVDTLWITFFARLNNPGEHREVFINDIELDCYPMFEIFDVCDRIRKKPVLQQAPNWKVLESKVRRPWRPSDAARSTDLFRETLIEVIANHQVDKKRQQDFEIGN